MTLKEEADEELWDTIRFYEQAMALKKLFDKEWLTYKYIQLQTITTPSNISFEDLIRGNM
jgi:hypothetical protein